MSDFKRGFSFNVNDTPITVVVADGKLWLAFYQLGKALGIGNLRKSLINHVTDSDLTYFLMENEYSGLNRHRFISEKGVFDMLQGRRDGKTDSLRLAIRDNIVPTLKADRLNIDPIDVDKDADLNIYYFNLNGKRLTAVFIDSDIYLRKCDVADSISIAHHAFDSAVRKNVPKKNVRLLNIPNKVNITTRASFVSNDEVSRILIDKGGQLCDDLREFIAMTVVPKMTPAIPESLAKDSGIKTSIPKKDCTATSCPLCERPCQAGSTDSGFITNNGACLKCCFGRSKGDIDTLLSAKKDSSCISPPAQTIGIDSKWTCKNRRVVTAVVDSVSDDGLNIGFTWNDALLGDKHSCIKSVDVFLADFEPYNTLVKANASEDSFSVQPIASFDVGAGAYKTVTCDFFSINTDTPKVAKSLNDGVVTMVEPSKSYDKDSNGAECSMDKTVAVFELLTGIAMTSAQGYKFIACLNLAGEATCSEMGK